MNLVRLPLGPISEVLHQGTTVEVKFHDEDLEAYSFKFIDEAEAQNLHDLILDARKRGDQAILLELEHEVLH